jgi:hypothetical protein
LTYAKRNRTSVKDIGYALYLYFLGLSYRNTSKALSRFIRRRVMSLSGNGFNTTNQKEYLSKEEKYQNL